MSSRTDSHNVSHAENMFSGDAYTAGAENGGRGLPRVGLVRADLGTPTLADADGVATAQAVGGAGDLTLDGALVTAGVATFDVARAVQIVSTNAGDTTQTATVTGTDAYGAPLVEVLTFNGTTVVSGAKAFKTVTQIAISAALVGNGSAGDTDILGLPFALADAGDVVTIAEAGVTLDVSGYGTIVGAVTTWPATGTTGDVRGTYNPTVALDGSTAIKLLYIPAGRKTVTGYGVPQFSG